MDYSIKVGVSHWSAFARSGDFYPDDMPADWRLAYFSHEFETACVAAADFFHAGDVCEQMQDLRSDFALGVAVYEQAEYSALTSALENCADVEASVRCVLANVDCVVGDSDGGDLCVLAQSALWTPDTPHRSSAIALLPAIQSLRQVRQWIEQWLATEPAQADLLLWLDGAHCSVQQLRDCQQLVELMGR